MPISSTITFPQYPLPGRMKCPILGLKKVIVISHLSEPPIISPVLQFTPLGISIATHGKLRLFMQSKSSNIFLFKPRDSPDPNKASINKSPH